MTYDASSRKDIRRAEKDSRLIDRQRTEIISGLMQSTSGRAYLWNELSLAHIFATSFSLDPLQMAFSEGERNCGLRLLNDIMETAPEDFILMMREQQHGRRNPDERPGSSNGDGSDSGSDSSGDTAFDE